MKILEVKIVVIKYILIHHEKLNKQHKTSYKFNTS
jgi:hypothetical protein